MKEALIARAKILAFITIIYNMAEGVVSIYFGLETEALSLLGFGIDSFIEVASASIVLLKLKGSDPELNLKHERRATLSIGALLIALSLSVFAGSVYNLSARVHPHTTFPGIIISALSLSFMFFLWKAKFRIGFQLDSATVMADARCSLACIKLSFIILIGSFVYWVAPNLWWPDSVAAILLSILILKEGIDLVQNARKAHFKGGCGCH